MSDSFASTKAEREKHNLSAEMCERFAKHLGAYIAFVIAIIVALVSGDGHIKTEGYGICFCALSLPPLTALFLLDYIVRHRQKRQKSAARGLMLALGFGLSTAGIMSILYFFSWIAAISYILIISSCALYVHEVAALGWHKKFEDI